MPGPLAESWRKVSFTHLTRFQAETGELDEYRDPDPADAAEAAAAAQGFFAFARGAKAGVCLHSLLEHLDWRNGTADRELVARALQQAGLLPVDAHRGQLDPVADTCRMLAALRDTVPDEPPVPFRELLAGHPRHEWRFHIAVDRLDPRALARVFRAHGDAVSAAHAEPLERLSGRAASGFLTGSADVICAHGGRYYVIDWKSNWLGNTFAAYGPLRLLASMHEHHYVLQYHLYLLALHRHLRRQLRDYDPERHLGGTIYVYLRGIGGGDRGSGTFAHRPPSALILALDRWAQGAAP
jgi:exodeoxyribonuclease V beta subunit